MAKKALIKITGKQIYGPDHDDSIELTTIGTLEETDDTYIICLLYTSDAADE